MYKPSETKLETRHARLRESRHAIERILRPMSS